MHIGGFAVGQAAKCMAPITHLIFFSLVAARAYWMSRRRSVQGKMIQAAAVAG